MKPPPEIPAAMRAFWATFESTQPGIVSDRFYEVCIFGDDEQTADALADLALRRVKRATAGLVWAYEAEGLPIPKPGDLSILANWRKEPLGIIETLRVDILPFADVTAEFAAVEGEGDGSLDYWRRAHWAFYTRECARIGRVPAPDMPVACERFALIFPRP